MATVRRQARQAIAAGLLMGAIALVEANHPRSQTDMAVLIGLPADELVAVLDVLWEHEELPAIGFSPGNQWWTTTRQEQELTRTAVAPIEAVGAAPVAFDVDAFMTRIQDAVAITFREVVSELIGQQPEETRTLVEKVVRAEQREAEGRQTIWHTIATRNGNCCACHAPTLYGTQYCYQRSTRQAWCMTCAVSLKLPYVDSTAKLKQASESNV